MIAARPIGIMLVGLACALPNKEVSGRDILFRKTPRDFGQTGELGRAYTREFERRMFRQGSWQQRLYCHTDDDDSDETLELYSTSDGSRRLSWRRVTPSISNALISRYYARAQFDLAKSLDSLRIKNGDIQLPPNVTREIERLWEVMLPGLLREPRNRMRLLIVRAPTFVGFRRSSGGVVAGCIADVAYGSRAYRDFVDIVDDLIDSCRKSSGARDAILARLPQKMQKLHARLSKSSNRTMERTADRRAPHF